MGLKNLHDQIHAGTKADRSPGPLPGATKKKKGKRQAHKISSMAAPVGVGPPARAAMPAATGIPPVGKLKR